MCSCFLFACNYYYMGIEVCRAYCLLRRHRQQAAPRPRVRPEDARLAQPRLQPVDAVDRVVLAVLALRSAPSAQLVLIRELLAHNGLLLLDLAQRLV